MTTPKWVNVLAQPISIEDVVQYLLGAIDLPALAAPLLLQRSPAARTLYWKLLLAPLPPLHAGSGIAARQPEQQRLHHLHSWLALQLRCGTKTG
jgi:hypothetical protein